MISLVRDRTDALIPAKYKGATKQKWDKKLLEAKREVLKGSIKKIPFDSAYWTEAKAQLKKETHGKCAYCEAPTDGVAHGDVEHFRPKSIYWWLAYTYDNYLFSCQICNQTYKSDSFPIANSIFPEPVLLSTTTDEVLKKMLGNISPDPVAIDKGYKFATLIAAYQKEKALLINPYYEDPSLYLAYEANDTLKEVCVVAPNSTRKPYTDAMIENFGLNRPELLYLRYGVYHTFKIFKTYSKNKDIPLDMINDFKSEIEKMKNDNHPFAGMVRFFDKNL